MTTPIQLSEPYAARPVRFLDILSIDGWRLKLYGIKWRGEHADQVLVDTAEALAEEALPRPAVTDDRYGVGFALAHDGRGGGLVFVDWWAGENELHHHAWIATGEGPGKLRPMGPGDFTGCVWDLAVICHERAAWVRHVLARPEGPDLDAYLADRLGGRV